MGNSVIDTSKLTDYCCSDPRFNSAIGHIDLTKNSELLAQLRDLKDKSDGETKCTICKAIQELEGPKTESCNENRFDWTWVIFLIFMFVQNFGNNSDTFDTFAKACAEVYGKEKEDNKDNLSSDAK